jgi:hypothetical protein
MTASLRIALASLIGLALLAAAPGAWAFGPDGHRIVAELAQRQLSPEALAEVRRLLGGQSDEGLAAIANWADEIREDSAWRYTSRWHYVNFPRGRCTYDATRDCADGRCIVAAITQQASILADRARSDDDRAQALRFLVHFIGDIHQPLHAGWGDDRGGNTFQVFYIGRGSNLHALWDGGILRSARLDWREQVVRLARRDDIASSSAASRWSPDAPAHWAEESCQLIEANSVYPARPGKLPNGYVERHYPLVEQRLVVAAARLASALNRLLSPDTMH